VSLIIPGLSGAVGHDPSAALYIDGKLIAAAEEERFVRVKHAQVDAVAIPFAPASLCGPAHWHYARRYVCAPDRSLDALLNGNRRFRRYKSVSGDEAGVRAGCNDVVPGAAKPLFSIKEIIDETSESLSRLWRHEIRRVPCPLARTDRGVAVVSRRSRLHRSPAGDRLHDVRQQSESDGARRGNYRRFFL
jgi:hypothetical protein